MTPSELRYQILNHHPDSHFFDRSSMRFFGDTMKNYGVCRTTIKTLWENELEVWELFRRRPVKFNNFSSAYFRTDNFKRVWKFKEDI